MLTTAKYIGAGLACSKLIRAGAVSFLSFIILLLKTFFLIIFILRIIIKKSCFYNYNLLQVIRRGAG